jgi:chemotaxis protein CheC
MLPWSISRTHGLQLNSREYSEGNEGDSVNESGWVAVNRTSETDRRSDSRGRRLSDVMRALSVVADIGCGRAGRALSEMAGTPIETKATQVRRVPLGLVPNLVGGPEAVVTATYLRIGGQIRGHMLLVLPLEDGCSLASILLGETVKPSLELPEMARSALGEVGNIIGSFFLSALGDSTGMELSPSPPAVAIDMSGAVLDVVLADLAKESNEALVIDTVFASGESRQKVDAFFLVLPGLRDLDVILDKLPK